MPVLWRQVLGAATVVVVVSSCSSTDDDRAQSAQLADATTSSAVVAQTHPPGTTIPFEGETAEARLARLDAGLRSVTAGLPEQPENPGFEFAMARCVVGPDGTDVHLGTLLSQQWLVLEGEPFTLLEDLDSQVLSVFPDARPNGGDTGLPDPFVTRGWDLGGGYNVSTRAIADRSLSFSITLGCGEAPDPVM